MEECYLRVGPIYVLLADAAICGRRVADIGRKEARRIGIDGVYNVVPPTQPRPGFVARLVAGLRRSKYGVTQPTPLRGRFGALLRFQRGGLSRYTRPCSFCPLRRFAVQPLFHVSCVHSRFTVMSASPSNAGP